MNSSTGKSADLFFLGLGIVFVALGWLLEPTSEAVILWGWRIPEVCLYQRLLEVDCLGCGMTRSTVYALQGELTKALEHHILGPILALGVVVQTVYRLWKICD